jgi:hypothetical protein
MFQQLKDVFRKTKETEAAIEQPTAEPSVPERTTAEQALIAELSGLTAVGASFVPAPAVEPEPIPAEPVAPKVDPAEAKVLAFLRICHVTDGLTHREIAGGTSLQSTDVKTALASLVANGTVKHSGEDEVNYRRYRLAVSVPERPSQPVEDFMTADQRWAMDARRRVLDAEAANRPPEPKRWTPSEEAITAEMEKRKSVKPLSPEERHQLKLLEGRVSRNPQEAIKR